MALHPRGCRRLLPILVALHLVPPAPAGAQSYRATLQLRWAADSSWQGAYREKPYRFHIHEELEGRLTFDIADSALAPGKSSASGAPASRAVRAIQLRDDGAASGAVLVGAAGKSAYTADVRKESGDCAPPDPRDTTGEADVPYEVRAEASGGWDEHAPGTVLIVLRGAEPIGIAISPKPVRMQSVRRLLCPQPEMATRWDGYRLTARAGELFRRADAPGGDPGRWTIATSRTAGGGYTLTARYDAARTLPRTVPADSSHPTGRLEVTKSLVLTWETVGRTERQ